MIKTLRITSIFSVVLAIVFFVLPIHYGIRSDEEISNFLATPSIIEQFISAEGTKIKAAGNQESRLVQEAQSFALYLNPPAPKVTPTTRSSIGSLNQIAQINTKPKFTVLGTCVYPKQPNLSMALVDESSGKGIHWVRQSETIGHLLVEEIKDGIIVVSSDTETYELEVQKPDNTPSQITVSPSSPSINPNYNINPQVRGQITGIREPIERPQRPQQNSNRSQQLQEVLSKIQMYKEIPNLSEEEKNKQVERLITDLQATYVDEMEAEQLNQLEELLKSNYLDSNDLNQ